MEKHSLKTYHTGIEVMSWSRRGLAQNLNGATEPDKMIGIEIATNITGYPTVYLTTNADPVLLDDDTDHLRDALRSIAGCTHQYAEDCDCDLSNAAHTLRNVLTEWESQQVDTDAADDAIDYLLSALRTVVA